MIVKVIVDIPSSQVNRPFDYLVPESWQSLIALGSRVKVPFGTRQLLAFVVGIEQTSTYSGNLKPISQVLDYESFLNQELIELSAFLAEDLQAFQISILQTMLPNMLKVKYLTLFTVQKLNLWQERYPALGQANEFDKVYLEDQLSVGEIKELLDQDILRLDYRLIDQTSNKVIKMLKTTLSLSQYQELLTKLSARSHQQRRLLEWLCQNNLPLTASQKQVMEASQVSRATIMTAIDKGWLTSFEQAVYRDPFQGQSVPLQPIKTLKDAQSEAYQRILPAVQEAREDTFLLEGVTGSGKTEIYLQLMAQALQMGKGAILLVPEIALTPQMVNRVKGRFQTGVAVLHSGLSTAEKYDEWRRIARGQAQIVVGARSSIFAPVANLGLIIMDEEHETTYKQSDNPRYHAREVALWRSHYHSCPLILGSATPSLESRARAQVGRYHLIRLDQRVNQQALPPVEIVDMTQVATNQEQTIFSPQLLAAIQTRLDRQEQVVLLLNRRGYASYMMCRECGSVLQCPRCDISLTYHKADKRMKCHYCDFQAPVPSQCPHCQGNHLRSFGLGTQKVSESLSEFFPQARILRMDVDTTRRKGQHEHLLSAFGRQEADILLGTQMIAKGLDFERVTLVGVINADTSLNLPDFRASEKTFQLLTQVAGRTGRGALKGEVIIQTYNPDHYVMQLAKTQDYEQFFYREMQQRHAANYPPYFFTTQLSVASNKQALAHRVIYDLKAKLSDSIETKAGRLIILGPSQAAIAKINNKYYFQIMLKYKDKVAVKEEILDLMTLGQQLAKQGVYLTIDHEPLFII
ncbi:primosomal protein N' [Vaginisenegalia massiliensis]|uniref:primosomal protein N' n=1 Tax=Vaginisenegalia massiliensis TaxID=2058294 RepID=UPI000F52F572|nr:primosomal protein N' [Vaginisenegalia massiliensis]